MHYAVVLVLLAGAIAPSGCGLIPPVDGTVVQSFAPIGSYDGHWGVDLAAPAGSEVVASDGGVVSFAGVVAGNRTVTVDHGGGVKSSYSYLSDLVVAAGSPVGRGELIGFSGVAHGAEAVHFSIRINGTYVNPLLLFECRRSRTPAALRLVPASLDAPRSAYPVEREARNSRRDFRSTAHRASDRR